LADATLHDLATNDLYWDKVVEIMSLGHHDMCVVTEHSPVVVQGVLVQHPLPESVQAARSG
jgi:replicative DNA helicase